MRKFRLFAGTVLALGLASACQAGTITATFNSCNTFNQPAFSNGQGTVVDVNLNNLEGGSAYSVEGDAGEYLWTQTAGTPILGNNGNFYTFCVELTQDIGYGGSYTYTTTSLTNVPDPAGQYGYPTMSTAQAGDIDNLWANEIGSVTNNDAATEFQTAIWDIIYDYNSTNTYHNNLSVGIVSSADGLSGTTFNNVVNSWVSTAVSDENSGDLGDTNLIALENASDQDQITALAVPLPGTFQTGFAILGIIAAFRVVRRRPSAVAV
jgi:hypothetical protein